MPMKMPDMIVKAPPKTKGLLSSFDMTGKWRGHTVKFDFDLVVRKDGTKYAIVLAVTKDGQTGRAHCDNGKLNAAGKLFCTVTIDAPMPAPFDKSSELEFFDLTRDHLQLWCRDGTVIHGCKFDRVETDSKTPGPLAMPSLDVPSMKAEAPDDDKAKQAETTVHEAFKSDYAKKSPADRAALADKLLRFGVETKDDPVARYALFSEARALAAAAGKWSVARDAIDRLDAGYKIDPLALREATLQILVKAGMTRDAAIEAADAATEGMKAAIARDQLPLAGGFLTIAGVAAAKSGSAPHVSAVKKAETEMKLIRQEAEAVGKAREILKTTPEDAAANLAVGRYDALRRQDWDGGVKLLARGGDTDLSAIARKELPNPTDAPAQQKIGDDYWKLAEKEKDSAWIRAALQARAAHWYRQAAPQLSGLALAIANERLKALDESQPIRAAAGGLAEVRMLKGHTAAVTCLYLADGRLLSGGLDGNLIAWDLQLGKSVSTIKSPVGPILSFSVAPTNRAIAINGKTAMRVVDPENPTVPNPRYPIIPCYPGAFYESTDFIFIIRPQTLHRIRAEGSLNTDSHNMRLNAIVGDEAKRYVTLGPETWLRKFKIGGFPDIVWRVPVAADSVCAGFMKTSENIAVGCVDKKIHLFDVNSKTITQTLEGLAGVPRCLAFTPEGDRLLSGGDEAAIRVWDVATGKEVSRSPAGSKGITAMLLTSDGKQLITGGSDGVIRIWSMPRENSAKE